MSRWVDQTTFFDPSVDEHGNCTEAAVASILGVSLEDVPNFRELGLKEGVSFWIAIRSWLKSVGFNLITFDGERIWDGLYLASGPSPRRVAHMIVMENGVMKHDPHPSREGIYKIDACYLIVPLDPSKSMIVPERRGMYPPGHEDTPPIV